MTDYFHRFVVGGNSILLKIVVTASPQWYEQYPKEAFSQLKFGHSVQKHNRYIFVTSDAEMKEENIELEELASYWQARIAEVLE